MLIEPQILILYTRLRFEKGNWVREKVIKKLKIVEFDISFTINISYCYPSGFRWYNQVFYFRWFALIIGCFSFVYLFALRIDDRVLCCINLSSLEKISLSMIFEEEWIGKTNFLDSEAYERIWRHTASTFLYVVYCFHYGLLCVLSFVINSNSSSRILLKNQVSTINFSCFTISPEYFCIQIFLFFSNFM